MIATNTTTIDLDVQEYFLNDDLLKSSQTKDVSVGGKSVTLQIWDTAGQERFQSLGTAYYRGADVCLLCFDLTNEATFRHLAGWHAEFALQAGRSGPAVVVGTKADLERSVPDKAVRDWCARLGAADDMAVHYTGPPPPFLE
eukprot:TRINITY_DN7357_c0_g1_i1.p1 TRINITY_DN7357_c0_g1~~TRINITY_DN7357_c0_g1_i1.p1  ORF type:complete len:142 (+),score=28.38 TRINITY_DN7357_c0_g1_i1:488-913(+)